jgi:hypothetical protein
MAHVNATSNINIMLIIIVILSTIAGYLVYQEEFSDKNFSVSLIILIMIYFGLLFLMIYYKYF